MLVSLQKKKKKKKKKTHIEKTQTRKDFLKKIKCIYCHNAGANQSEFGLCLNIRSSVEQKIKN